jgi:nucleoside-diphosphate-sugar epimerase
VTGGAGYIGSTLVPMLLEQGHQVAVFDALQHGIAPILSLFRDPRFSFARGDVRDRQALADFARDADAFVHLAAISGYPACEQAPDEARSTNVEGTRNVAAVAGRERPVVLASTCSCYGAVSDGICTEETPLRPLSLYGQTKAEAEDVMLNECDAIILRLATGYGLSPRLRLDLLVNDFVHRALRDRRLEVYEGHFRRSFLHVRDIARAVILALENLHDHSTDRARTGRVFNVGDPRQNCTKLELCGIIQKVIPGVDIDASASGRDADRRDYAISYERIQALGFEATISLEDGIRELASALRWT